MNHVFAVILISPLFATALPAPAAEFADSYKITPESVGLPRGNERSSEPFVVRIYKGTDDKVDAKQPKNFPRTITHDYEMLEDETWRIHEGVDLTSRPMSSAKPIPLDFKAGVHGIVWKAGDGPWGTIAVQLYDGSLIQYLHTSASHVEKGDIVAPDTKLGVTGQTGAGAIHLHIQAKDKNGNPISPDAAFLAGKHPLESKAKPDAPDAVEFDPELLHPVKPRVEGRKIIVPVKPESKWVSEVIGGGGKVQLVLGEFLTYQSAVYCSIRWSEAHPDDLRLTNEREVRLR